MADGWEDPGTVACHRQDAGESHAVVEQGLFSTSSPGTSDPPRLPGGSDPESDTQLHIADGRDGPGIPNHDGDYAGQPNTPVGDNTLSVSLQEPTHDLQTSPKRQDPQLDTQGPVEHGMDNPGGAAYHCQDAAGETCMVVARDVFSGSPPGRSGDPSELPMGSVPQPGTVPSTSDGRDTSGIARYHGGDDAGPLRTPVEGNALLVSLQEPRRDLQTTPEGRDPQPDTQGQVGDEKGETGDVAYHCLEAPGESCTPAGKNKFEASPPETSDDLPKLPEVTGPKLDTLPSIADGQENLSITKTHGDDAARPGTSVGNTASASLQAPQRYPPTCQEKQPKPKTEARQPKAGRKEDNHALAAPPPLTFMLLQPLSSSPALRLVAPGESGMDENNRDDTESAKMELMPTVSAEEGMSRVGLTMGTGVAGSPSGTPPAPSCIGISPQTPSSLPLPLSPPTLRPKRPVPSAATIADDGAEFSSSIKLSSSVELFSPAPGVRDTRSDDDGGVFTAPLAPWRRCEGDQLTRRQRLDTAGHGLAERGCARSTSM